MYQPSLVLNFIFACSILKFQPVVGSDYSVGKLDEILGAMEIVSQYNAMYLNGIQKEIFESKLELQTRSGIEKNILDTIRYLRSRADEALNYIRNTNVHVIKSPMEQVVYAINCGGSAHIDSNGIYYKKDPYVGPAAKRTYLEFAKIWRAQEEDYDLYRTLRYSDHTFGYKIPIVEDGDYVMVLKFVEGDDVTDEKQREFDIILNSEHTVVKDFDMYEIAGPRVAIEVYVPFTINKGSLEYKGIKSTMENDTINIDFVRTDVHISYYWIHICAIYVMKGNIDNVPTLQPIHYPSS